MTPRRKNANALGDIPEGIMDNEYLRDAQEEEMVEVSQEEMAAHPIVFASRRLAASLREAGMDLRDAPADSQREYAGQCRRMAGAIREAGGVDPAAVSMMMVMNAILVCDTKEDTEALIGEKVEDTVDGLVRVLERYGEILDGWADEKEALNG